MTDPTSPIADALGRLAYRSAYLGARTWWFVRRPKTSSALVALWHEKNHLLVVRSSYRPHYLLPGGFIRRGESALTGALRELREELAVNLGPDRLTAAWTGTLPFEHRQDTITVFEASGSVL